MKLAQMYPMYYRDKVLAGYSKVTLKNNQLHVRLLSEHLGDVDIADVTCEQLKDYLFGQIQHMKPSSLGAKVRAIRSFFKWATDEGYITENPSLKVKEPKIRDMMPRYLLDEEIKKIQDSCKKPLEKVIIEFSFTTGSRIGEIVQINRKDINWEDESVVVIGKGNKPRKVYFSQHCKQYMEEYLNARTDEDPALIVTERAPHRMSISEMRFIVKRIAKNAGLETVVYPHKLRHSFATHMLNEGASVESIRQLLGHEDINHTMIYAKLTEQGKKNAHHKAFD